MTLFEFLGAPLGARAAKAGAAVLLSLSLAGCFASGDAAVTGAVSGGAAAPAALVRQPTLLVATTRRPAENPEERPWFTAERGRGLAFAEARLSPPDRSLMGRVASVVAGDWAVASVGPVREAGAAQAFAEAAMGRDVLLLVHGYRESFETAALAAARLSDGIGFTGATGVFSWPSGGGTFDYVHDRDSAMWSRDALEELLTALSRSSSGGRVHVMAHSMGTLLALETLRTLRASGGEAAMARIGAVVLASPDVDVDLFVRSVERLGPDAKKITVITSTKDRALGLSARIAGGVRAGAADRDRLAKLEALGVRIADASDYGAGFVNHDLFLSNDDVREVVRRAIERAG